MPINPQKYSQSSRPVSGGGRSGGNGNDGEWSEEKALEKIKKRFGENCFDEILSKKKPDYNTYICNIKTYVDDNLKEITTSQLRNVFSRINKVKPDNLDDLYILRPKLAYVSGRSDNNMKTLVFMLDCLITKTDNAEKLAQFQAFFEAVIAYHKYYEKRSK
jgi:CRISPR type III-A-associated protein Csm2